MNQENKQDAGKNSCCAGPDFSACCEQMKKMMQGFCSDKEGGFDPAAMMQKMREGDSAED